MDNQLREWMKSLLVISEAIEAGHVTAAEFLARQLFDSLKQSIDDRCNSLSLGRQNDEAVN